MKHKPKHSGLLSVDEGPENPSNEGGFMAMERADKVIEKIIAPPIEIDAPAIPEHKTVYHVIRIHSKRHDHDQEIVHVHAGCKNKDYDFRMRRDSLIPVPEEVCQVLLDACYPQYRMPTDGEMLEGRSEKVVGKIQRFTFDTVFRNIPEDVYQKLHDRAVDPNAKPVTEKEIEAMLGKGKN